MSFRITGLPSERFTHLFELPDEVLALQGAVRRIADSRTSQRPGPCWAGGAEGEGDAVRGPSRHRRQERLRLGELNSLGYQLA